jgi:lipopolysaccharide export system protein LptA
MSHKRSVKIALCSFVATSCLLSIAAVAQVIDNHNSKAPVTFDAGQIELQDRADRVILSGGVVVTQAGLTIRASRLTAAYSRTNKVNVNRLDAVGGVAIAKDDLRANANAAIYDLDRDLITLVGNVQLQQGANRLNGGRILIDLNTGRTTINGGATAPTDPAIPGVTKTSSGRVTGTFTVPQSKN